MAEKMRWLTRSLWLGGIVLLVWISVVVYWQSTARSPSEADLLIYMALLPLLVAGAAWGVYKVVFQPKPLTAETTGAPTNQAATKAMEQAAMREQAEREWTLNIVATSLHTSSGKSASEVLTNLLAGKIEPALDPELKNPDGFPVFSARIADLDTADLQETLAEWQKACGQTDVVWSESQYRALHLASESLRELAGQVAMHSGLQQYLQHKEEGRTVNDEMVIPLRLIAYWPGHWPAEKQSTASSWAKSLVAAEGWPESRILLQESVADRSDPIASLDRVNVGANKNQLPTVGLLVACDSTIDQETVDSLAAAAHLFGGANTRGVKPGELAAGLLFADSAQSLLLGAGPFPVLHRASWASREKSADERGRVSADLLGKLVDLALKSAGLDASTIKMVSSDNDHKPSRESELAEMLNATLPDLDFGKDAIKVAQACGSMNHFTTVAALCVAHQYVVDEQAPAICVSLQDPLMRTAVVLSPSMPQSA